jgi:signal transduction histidine kinase
MISKFLFVIQRGIERVKTNSKLLFLIVVLFVFPILFVVVLEQFYTSAQANIQTLEQQYIGTFHDSVSAVSKNSLVETGTVLALIKADNDNIVGYRVYESVDNNLIQIVYSSVNSEVGATGTTQTLLKTTLQENDQTFSTFQETTAGRLVQSARFIPDAETPMFLYTEHSFAQQDVLFAKRKQNAYMVLTLIFAFLIGLAYWINRQADWEKQYNTLHSTLKERDLFSNMIAHEFRTPLTAIKGYASFLQESSTIIDEEKRYADTISESAERLVLLVNDFLEIARIQSGRMKIVTTEIDVRSTIETVVASLQKDAQHKNIQLVFTPSLTPQLLTTDQNRFIQILTNIVSNSVKYTDSGTVAVNCEQDRTGVTIRIKDTGMGITAEDQQKLFTPFARVGGVEKTTTTGTGLGMWITKKMIELLNGTITVESIKGVGTHVVLHFKQSKH